MKVTAILLLIGIGVCGAANSYSQNTGITLRAESKTIKEVFAEIEKSSEFVFFYFHDDVDLDRRVSVNVKDKKINEILDQLFQSTDTGYSIKDRQVYITKKATEESRQAGKRRITGSVTDAYGDPLIGVTVSVKNTTGGTVTDINGMYVIDAKETDILLFSYVGFLKQEIRLGDKDLLNVILQEDDQMLEEVVVVGYGQQSKASVVSSVSTVTSKELTAPTSNLTNNLAGQLAGLISIQRSGEPGRDDAEFWIRGISTFKGGTNPLVLVDGVPRAISNIEPDEIETFSLLKDAAATAVYGAEGANGVILITSKRGTISKPKITFRGEYSISQPTRLPDFVDSWDYIELANEANFNDGENPYKYPEEIDRYRDRIDNDLYPNSKWMDELLANNYTNQRYTLNFRGGAENAKYFVSMAYFQQEGIFKQNPMSKYKGDFGFERYNLRSNIDLNVTKTTSLSIDLSGQYVNRTTSNRSPDDIFKFMLHTPPHLFPPIYSDGTLATYLTQSDGNNRNPYNMLMNQGYRKMWGTLIQSNIGLNQDLGFITPGLKFNGKVSLDYDGNFSTLRNHWPSLFNATGRDEEGNLIFSTSESGSPELKDPETQASVSYRRIYIEGALNYLRTFQEKHTLGGMFLYMQKETQESNVVLPYRKQGMVGRATYSYDNRYFIEGNFGYTGSETFAKGKKFGFFPAVGLSYYISNEQFYPESLSNIMNKAKIRLSYGRTGNDDTGGTRFLYRATFNMDAGGFNQGIGSSGGTNGLGAGIKDVRFVNNNIQWEIEKKRNVGVDLGFMNNRIELTADYFNNRRENILMERNTIPGVAGFHARPWENYGIVDNHGLDASLNVRQDWGQVKVSMRGTFTFARNKVIEYDELPKEYPWQAVTGTRVNDHELYIAERLYTEDDFIKTQKANGTYTYELRPGLPDVTLEGILGPGDIKYRDINNDGRIDNFDKVRGVGHPYNPEINYGFGINVEYKGFYVSTFFQGTGNSTILLASGNNTFFPFNWGIEKSNIRKEFLDSRWTADNPSQHVIMPRLHVGYAKNVNKEPSTWWLRNGSFLRFKNLEVGYNIPKQFTQKLLVNGARVYLQGYNLYVWDDVKYWDPELGNKNGGNSYPLPRTFTLGVELNF
ncbi:TonB-dependent receptor [Proteiniphilum sp.]|uniref:TonB-dependent receptor n=1 Tax=Proteiniphilum sp. TaxID=1926877 RepID=UPI00331FA1C2